MKTMLKRTKLQSKRNLAVQSPSLSDPSLNQYFDDDSSSSSSSSDEDDKIWDDRWVKDENEEEEKRLWAEKQKQLEATSPKPDRQDTRKHNRNTTATKKKSKSDEDETPNNAPGGSKKNEKKRRSAELQTFRSYSDELTNSEEIKTSEEEDNTNRTFIPPYYLGATILPLTQLRSNSVDENLFVVSRGRSLSAADAMLRSQSDRYLHLPSPAENKSLEDLRSLEEEDEKFEGEAPGYEKKKESGDKAKEGGTEKEKEKEKESEKGNDYKLKEAHILPEWRDKRAQSFRARSLSSGGAKSVYSPLPRRRRALTPQRTPRPFIKTAGVTGEDPPSGGGNGEEEALEWKPLWKAN